MQNIFEELFMKNIKEDLDKEVSPLVLAYIGDAVFELFIRLRLISDGESKVNTLHKEGIKYVKAKAQADIVKNIEEMLYDDEKDILRRGRNAMSATIPKNADIIDYKYATGFEALIGYLCTARKYDRLMEILNKVY